MGRAQELNMLVQGVAFDKLFSAANECAGSLRAYHFAAQELFGPLAAADEVAASAKIRAA